MYTMNQPRSHSIPQPPPPLSMDHIPGYPPPTNPAGLAQVPPQMPQTPQPVSTRYEGRIYELRVVQQPVRARMCGFGDKDRRPITPPPCVRLIVRDENDPSREVDINEIDTTFFVLTVDLWNAEGSQEVNLVHHSATSPSISAASAVAFPPPPQPQMRTYPSYAATQSPYGQPQPAYGAYYGAQQGYQPQPAFPYGQQAPQAAYGYPGVPSPAVNYYPTNPGQAIAPQPPMMPHMQTGAQGMFTRNLIGSLSVSAFRLTDTENKIGIWFILQDLSVRTEGTFRLKMNFVNVGVPPAVSSAGSSEGGSQGSPVLNVGTAPVLASVFSNVFEVYSAKKFPGVIESTPLSKCFAIQGIKIPIRKDGVKGARNAAGGMQIKGQDEEWDE